MNTFQLSCFLAVADALNFARAAERMNISQPSISHQIQSLENELHTKLFRRSTRSVEITQEGLTFLHDARNIVALSERAKKRFEATEQKTQLLSIGCCSYAQLGLLSRALKKLAQSFPGLHPDIRIVSYDLLHKLLEDGQIHAGLLLKTEKRKMSHAVFKPLKKCPVVCVCSPDHPLARKTAVRSEELSAERLILFSPAHAIPDVVQLQWCFADNRSPSELFFCDTAEAAATLAASDFGVAVLPEVFVPPVQDIAVIPIKKTDAFSFGVYYEPEMMTPLLNEFIELLVKEAAEK